MDIQHAISAWKPPTSQLRPLGATRFGNAKPEQPQPSIEPAPAVTLDDYRLRLREVGHELGNGLNGLLIHPTRAANAIERFMTQFRQDPASASPNLLEAALDELKLGEGQINTMADMTRAVLNRRQEVEPAQVDFNALIPDILAGFRNIKKYQGATLEFIPNPNGAVGWADSGKMRQVLQNLIKNALEATRNHGHIRLEARPSEQPGGMVLTVADNGPGIPVQIRDRLFEPEVSTKGEGGSGIGLFISRRIVEGHGGTLTVHSEPGQGSRFTITLPAAQSTERPG